MGSTPTSFRIPYRLSRNNLCVDFSPSAREEHRQFVRVEEVTYETGAFQFQRIWNRNETDWRLNLGTAPVLLRVPVARY